MPETFATSCGWVDGKCFRCGRTQPDRHDTSRCPALAPDAREEAERRGALEAVEYAAEDTEAQEDFLTGWRTALRWQAAQQSETHDKASRFDAEDKAALIDFAAERIQAVWNDAGEVTAQVLAENVVAAQEFAWLSMHFPVQRSSVQSETRITGEMIANARQAIHKSIVQNHFGAIAPVERWNQSDYEAMLNEFATVALVAALEGEQQ